MLVNLKAKSQLDYKSGTAAEYPYRKERNPRRLGIGTTEDSVLGNWRLRDSCFESDEF